MYKIEKGVLPQKIPNAWHNGRKEFIFSLEPGDSFICPFLERKRFFASAAQYGVKLKSRSIGDGLVRVWKC